MFYSRLRLPSPSLPLDGRGKLLVGWPVLPRSLAGQGRAGGWIMLWATSCLPPLCPVWPSGSWRTLRRTSPRGFGPAPLRCPHGCVGSASPRTHFHSFASTSPIARPVMPLFGPAGPSDRLGHATRLPPSRGRRTSAAGRLPRSRNAGSGRRRGSGHLGMC